MARIEVFPPHGFIELKKWSGDELDIVNAARVSFANESEWDEVTYGIDIPGRHYHLKEKDKGLIKFLLRERHGTPFEQGMMAHWHIKCPIFVARQWFKHRIGCSYNEMSGRYTPSSGDYYIPDVIRSQVEGSKPGAYEYEPLQDDHDWVKHNMEVISREAVKHYRWLMRKGVSKEQARIILPQNMYTEFRWTTNARSLMHFLSLRNEPQAQYEIQQYAKKLEWEFAKALPTVHEAFIENGCVAP